MEQLKIAPGPNVARDLISSRIIEHGRELGRRVDILEAGCGREWNIVLTGIDVHLTGVDLDAKAIGYRRDVVGDLDEAIVGDLRTVAVPKSSYDVVFSAFVLEHIKGARSVLDGMVDALRPGGLLILRVPDGDSVYAFLARLLPFWTHVLYKRITQRDPMAGKPGHPPYRVVYDDVVTRSALRAYAAERGLVVLDELGTNPHIDNLGRLGGVGMFVQRLIARLSGGRLVGTHNNLTLILKK
jgi:SAM-dependent methyltransferase